MSEAPDRPAPLPRVGYLGPEGTFSEQALLSSAAPDAVEPVALATISDAVMALPRREVDWAIVPIENSIEGSVNVTLDLLAREAENVQITGEALLQIRHSLIAARPMALQDIDTVITHPQVPGQCSRVPALRARGGARAARHIHRRGGPHRVRGRAPRTGGSGHGARGADLRRDRPARARRGPR